VTRIIIEPAPMELGLHRDAYEALVEDLRERGFDAEIRRPDEQRSAEPSALVNAALWLGEEMGRDTLEVVVGIFIARMLQSRTRRKKPPPRPPVAVFYGPNGKPLKRIEIPRADRELKDGRGSLTVSQRGVRRPAAWAATR
jgi:hypothetical protein